MYTDFYVAYALAHCCVCLDLPLTSKPQRSLRSFFVYLLSLAKHYVIAAFTVLINLRIRFWLPQI